VVVGLLVNVIIGNYCW